MTKENLIENDLDFKDLVLSYTKEYGEKKLRDRGVYLDDGKPRIYVMYCRKSTDEKGRQEMSLDDQVRECRSIAEREHLNVFNLNNPILEKKSAKKSGVKQRPQFYELIKQIREGGPFNSILCWAPDRLSRNMKDAGEIIDLLDRKIIKDIKFGAFSFVNDYNGLMTLGFQFLMAKQYSDLLSVNIKRGHKNMFYDGRSPDKKSTYGYVVNKARYFRADGENHKLLIEAFRQAKEGVPEATIASFLNSHGFSFKGKQTKMTKQKVSVILRNPFYTGIYAYGDEIVDLCEKDKGFRPVVSYRDFILIRSRFGNSKYFAKKQASEELLRKMVVCGYCGNYMTPNKPRGNNQKRYFTLTCTNQACESRAYTPMRNNIRGFVIRDYAYEAVKNGLTISKADFDKLMDEAQFNSLQAIKNDKELNKQITLKVNQLKNQMQACEVAMNNTNATQELKDIQIKRLNELGKEVTELEKQKKELEQRIEDNLGNSTAESGYYDQFSNFIKFVGETIKYSENKALVDKTYRMVFSNFTIKDKKVLSHQFNPDFEQYLKVGNCPSKSSC